MEKCSDVFISLAFMALNRIEVKGLGIAAIRDCTQGVSAAANW